MGWLSKNLVLYCQADFAVKIWLLIDICLFFSFLWMPEFIYLDFPMVCAQFPWKSCLGSVSSNLKAWLYITVKLFLLLYHQHVWFFCWSNFFSKSLLWMMLILFFYSCFMWFWVSSWNSIALTFHFNGPWRSYCIFPSHIYIQIPMDWGIQVQECWNTVAESRIFGVWKARERANILDVYTGIQ